MLTRRVLLKSLLLAAGCRLLPLGRGGWALAAPESDSRCLVVILLRGAIDGLNVVTPYAEHAYYELRPNIALPPPGQNEGLVNLDGFFGLNPSLAMLMPLWKARSLAFIHASGSPAKTRSHFEAQDILETAMLNTALAKQGWLNALAQILPENQSPTRALSFGNTLPKIFQGRYNVATVPVRLHVNKMPIKNPGIERALNQMYSTHPELDALYRQAVAARENMVHDLAQEMESSARGAPMPDVFAQETANAATMIRRDPHIQLVFLDVGGWDTHVNQGSGGGQLANKLGKLGEGLLTLAQGLGPAYDHTSILIMSEFGRTVAENGNGGTDHGHGNVAWLMGGGVSGGKVWGRWPGLHKASFYEGRDLDVTTDFRAIIGRVLAAQFELDDQRIGSIISDYKPDNGLRGLYL